MIKGLLMISLILCSGMVLAQSANEFEAELKHLEGRDEAAFERAEKITSIVTEGVKMSETDTVEDSVSTGNAATLRKDTGPGSFKRSGPIQDSLVQESPVQKTRRIRSR